jgi:hypothetical protein
MPIVRLGPASGVSTVHDHRLPVDEAVIMDVIALNC